MSALHLDESPSPAAPQALADARAAAERAGVITREIEDMGELLAASWLFGEVWGRGPEGVPIHSEMMRELVHAGGCVSGAFEGDELVGAAVLGVARPAGATYGYLAATRQGRAGGGLGRALKLHQRAWALAQGLTSMRWTFDPLVARNARFNLGRLGATAPEYEIAFFGRMSDSVNGDDDADRLVVCWRFDDDRVAALASGADVPDLTPESGAEALTDGPDGAPMLLRDPAGLWLRVPVDVVELRRRDAGEASAWRAATREAFVAAFEQGRTAVHVTRDGWYLLKQN